MSAAPISIKASAELISIHVRNLITAAADVRDVLDVHDLRFTLAVPIQTTEAARAGSKQLASALERRIDADVGAVIYATRKSVDEDTRKLGKEVRKLLGEDGAAAKGAKAKADQLIRPLIDNAEQAVDALPPAIRKAIKEIMRNASFSDCFAKQKLNSVGSWGFVRDPGLRVRAGLLRADADDDDKAIGERLWDELSSARSHSRKFVLVLGHSVGLVVGSTISSTDHERARAMSDGGSSSLEGVVSYKDSAYHFDLAKPKTQGTRDKFAKRVRDMVKARCGKSIGVRFDDDDQEKAEG